MLLIYNCYLNRESNYSNIMLVLTSLVLIFEQEIPSRLSIPKKDQQNWFLPFLFLEHNVNEINTKIKRQSNSYFIIIHIDCHALLQHLIKSIVYSKIKLYVNFIEKKK